MSETWLKSDIPLSHPDICVYRNDREVRRGGGVAIIVRNCVSHLTVPIVNTKLIENIGIKIRTDYGDLSIYSCYFPGGRIGSDGARKKIFAADIHKLTRSERYILGGDFNSRHQSWGCTRANCWGNILYEKQDSYNMNIAFPSESTYIPSQSNRQSSVLDIFITNIIESLSSADVINNLGSDHLPVKIVVNNKCDTAEFQILNFQKANWYRYARYISRHLNLSNLDICSNTDQIDANLAHFIRTIKEAISVSVPVKYRRNSNRKLPNFIKSLIRTRNFYRRKWQRYRNTIDFNEYKTLNSIIQWQIEKFRNSSWNLLLSRLDKGSPPFWNLTKIIGKKSRVIPILKFNNTRFSTSQEKCEILGKTFANNHTCSANLTNPVTESQVQNTVDGFRFSPVPNQVHLTYDKTLAIIKGLKIRKSPGLDGINNSCIKFLPKKGVKFLTAFINNCLNFGHFPNVFKEAKIIAIRKPGKPTDSPSSYRPISLLSAIGKVLERAVKEQISEFIDENNILPREQFGFRRELSTVHPLVRIRNIVKTNFSKQESTGMVLLDIKAAFDSVWHNGLIFKLLQLKFPPHIIKFVQNFLTFRKFRVHIGSKRSSLFDVNAGCPQGSCLSPVLYNIYTSDIPALPNCVTSIFADDTAVLSASKLPCEIISNLQTALRILLDYFTKWKIAVNREKFQAIYFTRKRKECFIPQAGININNMDIKWETKVKYLGVTQDTKLTYKEHISYIINKCNILIRTLYPFINRTSALSTENKMLIFKQIFQSVIFYAAPVWSTSATCHLTRLQILQNKLLKLIYNLPKWHSTLRLHQIANTDLVVVKIRELTEKFYSKCSERNNIELL